MFRSLGVIADDYSFINPGYDERVVNQILAVFEAKKGGKINPIDYDYKFFAGDSKANYSIDIESELTYLIITPDTDAQMEIDKFVADNRGVWKPVVKDLNAAFHD